MKKEEIDWLRLVSLYLISYGLTGYFFKLKGIEFDKLSLIGWILYIISSTIISFIIFIVWNYIGFELLENKLRELKSRRN